MPIDSRMIDNMKADRVRKVADLANRRTRERFGRFLIEGPQSVREAVTWMPDAVRDLYVQAVDGPDGPRIAGETLTSIVERSQEHRIYVHPASEAVMRRISPDCQGIAAVGDADAVRATAQGRNCPKSRSSRRSGRCATPATRARLSVRRTRPDAMPWCSSTIASTCSIPR